MRGSIYCANASKHLLQCEEFECSRLYFKCPGYYCLPWRNVCNRIWDCPGGADENQCTNRASCKGQFKCHGSKICVNIESTCDDIIDCPYQDDEMFCKLSTKECPVTCRCLLYTISCWKDKNYGSIEDI